MIPCQLQLFRLIGAGVSDVALWVLAIGSGHLVEILLFHDMESLSLFIFYLFKEATVRIQYNKISGRILNKNNSDISKTNIVIVFKINQVK
jgi:hypothetical protein